MSPRKSSQTADAPSLPTIKDYFGMMAKGQRDDIRRLKRAATGKNSGQSQKQPTNIAIPDPWLMHPTRRTKRSAAKPTAKSTARSASKKAAKKVAKKTPKKARRASGLTGTKNGT